MSIVGAPNFIAPEVLKFKFGHSFEVDVWSLGICIYFMLVGKPPFAANDAKEIHKKVQNGEFKFPKDTPISEEAEDLITKLLFQNPQKRPVLEEIVIHPFFQKNKLPRILPRSSLKEAPDYNYLKDYIPIDKIKDAPKQTNFHALGLSNHIGEKNEDGGQISARGRIRNEAVKSGSLALENRLQFSKNSSTPNLKLSPMR